MKKPVKIPLIIFAVVVMALCVVYVAKNSRVETKLVSVKCEGEVIYKSKTGDVCSAREALLELVNNDDTSNSVAEDESSENEKDQ
jgi:hypothetical protein